MWVGRDDTGPVRRLLSCTPVAAWYVHNTPAAWWRLSMPVPVTTGSTLFNRVEVAGFHVTRVRFPPLLRLRLHEHERATVAVVLTGSFDGMIRSTTQPCPPGTLRTEPAGEQHGNL